MTSWIRWQDSPWPSPDDGGSLWRPWGGEVLTLISRGSTNKEAAKLLFISEATVKTHLVHAYAKLGVKDRAAAVATAFARGLLGG